MADNLLQLHVGPSQTNAVQALLSRLQNHQQQAAQQLHSFKVTVSLNAQRPEEVLNDANLATERSKNGNKQAWNALAVLRSISW